MALFNDRRGLLGSVALGYKAAQIAKTKQPLTDRNSIARALPMAVNPDDGDRRNLAAGRKTGQATREKNNRMGGTLMDVTAGRAVSFNPLPQPMGAPAPVAPRTSPWAEFMPKATPLLSSQNILPTGVGKVRRFPGLR